MDKDTQKQLQKEYESLGSKPGSNMIQQLKMLAAKYNITYEELLDNIDL